MTGSSLVANALKNTPKGKLVYRRNLENTENESESSTNLFLQSIAKKLDNASIRGQQSKDELNNTFFKDGKIDETSCSATEDLKSSKTLSMTNDFSTNIPNRRNQ